MNRPSDPPLTFTRDPSLGCGICMQPAEEGLASWFLVHLIGTMNVCDECWQAGPQAAATKLRTAAERIRQSEAPIAAGFAEVLESTANWLEGELDGWPV